MERQASETEAVATTQTLKATSSLAPQRSRIVRLIAKSLIPAAVVLNGSAGCANDEMYPLEGQCFNGDGTPCDNNKDAGSGAAGAAGNDAGASGGTDGGNDAGAGASGGTDGGNDAGAGAGGETDGGNDAGAGAGGETDGGNDAEAGAGGETDGGNDAGAGAGGGTDGGNEGDACQTNDDCEGLTRCCNDVCRDITSDENNCGTCGVTCSTPTTECWEGTCSCPFPTTLCGNNACVDTDFHVANCGGCGNVCSMGQTCQNGACNN